MNQFLYPAISSFLSDLHCGDVSKWRMQCCQLGLPYWNYDVYLSWQHCLYLPQCLITFDVLRNLVCVCTLKPNRLVNCSHDRIKGKFYSPPVKSLIEQKAKSSKVLKIRNSFLERSNDFSFPTFIQFESSDGCHSYFCKSNKLNVSPKKLPYLPPLCVLWPSSNMQQAKSHIWHFTMHLFSKHI